MLYCMIPVYKSIVAAFAVYSIQSLIQIWSKVTTQNEAMTQYNCQNYMLPIRDALDIVVGKWKLYIIFHLRLGPKRFNELQKEIHGITPRMLSKELKDLEQNHLVKREVFDTSPVTVVYSVTEHGKSLCPVINSLYEWGEKHRERVLRADFV